MARLVLKAGGAGGPGLPVRNGLVAEYRVDDGSGTNLNDYTLNALDGTLPVAPATPTWATQGLSFDGGSDYISLPNGISTGLNGASGVTILAVVNRAAIGAAHYIVDMTHVGATSKVYLQFNSSNKLAFRVRSVSTDSVNITKTTTATYTDTTEYMVIVGVGNLATSRIDIYVNGVKEGASVVPTFGQTTFAAANGNAPVIGTDTALGGSWFNGSLCWFAEYNRALSQSEISKNQSYLVSKLKKSRGITIS